jgi:uncharacterized protein
METPMAELVASEKQRRFGRDKLDLLSSVCLTCDFGFACRGGCPKDRLLETGSGKPGPNYLCEGYMRFFRHLEGPMQTMADLLRQGMAPAMIMERYRDEDEKLEAAIRAAGRNDPCPCGSGIRLKRCHGKGRKA